MISQQKRLSKKERKVVAFRARKGKGKLGEDEALEVPIIDMVRDGEDVSTQTTHQSRKDVDEKPVNKKRKRDAADEDANPIATEETPKPKKRKRVVSGAGAGEQTNLAETKVEENNSSKYILFVGNLSYKTTKETIEQHFSQCNPSPTVRQLTKRVQNSSATATKEKSRGCAFLEFREASGLQSALRLHHSVLDGRKINVELSAGGGGNSASRVKKLKVKNAKLDQHRLGGKNAKSDTDKQGVPHPSMAGQVRFSTTSGAALQQSDKKTWSIPEGNEKASRGGQRHRGKKADRKGQPDGGWAARKQHPQFTPSGANAIVVG